MALSETTIQNALYRHFANYEYKLNNTFVFNWESDFFAMSKSGYFIECEVKISRSDFFKDFEKDKHELFKSVSSGKTHYIHNLGPGRWDTNDHNIIGRVIQHQLVTQYGGFGSSGKTTMRSTGWGQYGWATQRHKGKLGHWVNDYGHVQLRPYTEVLRAPFTQIRIHPIENIHVPHQFYYAVPDGLIKLNEIPPYAGLIYLHDQDPANVQVMKRAPYLHKRKMNMDRVLLKKYYNLWQYKVDYLTKQKIREAYSE